MVFEARIRNAINDYIASTGKSPEYLILGDFIHEGLKNEYKTGPEATIGELKNLAGTPVILLRKSLVVS